ncbi:MAG: CDP-diacylglycerol--glycerol-3-phosphate 3-phosphatidyltransferase [Pseudomonadota bacterium]
MIWTVPNILTLGRLVAAPAMALPFVLMPRPEADAWALALFVVASLTDWLDGWLARRLGQESALGQVMDPIADKAMVLIALAVVLGQSPHDAELLLVPIVLILFREVAVSGLREAMGGRGGLQVTPLAKWKTTVQMAAIALLLAAPLVETGAAGLPSALPGWLGIGLLWVAAVLTLITGADYAAKAVRVLRRQEEH